MRGLTSWVVACFLSSLFCFSSSVVASEGAELKEWTFMVFLNGNNNLDPYGALNINQMEKVGSTEDLNLVVQWASLANPVTKRLLVKKDNDFENVTSPTVEELPRIDMGDHKNLSEFIRWTAQKYPAKRYFLTIWNHGNGWHRGREVRDISHDEISGNSITTVQLGQAMAEGAKHIGHRIDIVGSDACLMAMVEVGDEMADSVDVAIASEELEPGLGWPYDKLVERWAAHPKATPAEVATILTEEYVKSFQTDDVQGDVTLSSVNLRKSAQLNVVLAKLAQQITKLSPADLGKLLSAVSAAQKFAYSDYVDLGDLLERLGKAELSTLGPDLLTEAKQALASYVISNHVTAMYAKATGVSLWVPSSKSTYDTYATKYQGLKFHAATGWGDALAWMLKAAK